MTIDVTSPEDLIISKLFWAKDSMSEIQLKDVRNLLKTIPDMDINYIKQWVTKLRLDEVYKEASNE